MKPSYVEVVNEKLEEYPEMASQQTLMEKFVVKPVRTKRMKAVASFKIVPPKEKIRDPVEQFDED